MSLLVIGNISIDTIEIEDQRVETIGGGAYYTAIAASLTGCTTFLAGLVGTDLPANSIPKIEQLRLDYLKVESGLTTRFNLRYDGAKTLKEITSSFGSRIVAPTNLFPSLMSMQAVHITCKDPVMPEEFLPYINTSILSTDVSWSSLEKKRTSLELFLPHVKYIFMNLQEHALFTKWFNFIHYPDLVAIITRGDEGVQVFKEGSLVLDLPAYRVDVIDPTGAGDTLAGGCIGMLCQNKEFVSSLSFGSAIASICVEGWGSSHLESNPIAEIHTRAEWILSRAKYYGG